MAKAKNAKPAETPEVETPENEWPQEGGTYTRDSKTGVLTRVDPPGAENKNEKED